MEPRTIVITGASDGVGAAAARILAAKGERVVLVGRSPDKTHALARELGAPAHLADFAELAQVRRLAAELLDAYPHIDVLANNAGGIMGARRLTVDGFEATLQVNHLAPFLLTQLLLEEPGVLDGATVIQTSSVAARRFARLDLDDLQNERHYSPNRAYGDAKLANILFTVELQRRYAARGIAAVAFHPGMIATSFAAGSSSWFRWIYRTPLARLVLEPPGRGGERLVFLADGVPGQDWTPGGYYERNVLAVPPPLAADEAAATTLWHHTATLLAP